MLTIRQNEVLEFLRSSHRANGLMPSTREIQQHFGFASQTAAVDVLRALERKGRLHRLPGKARGIVLHDAPVPSTESRVVCIPLHGGSPSNVPEPGTEGTGEFLTVDSAATGVDSADSCFALKVQGDSMIGAHVLDGDYVILDATTAPRHLDIVAVVINGAITLKRIMMHGPQRWLKAENPLDPDLLAAEDFPVQGVMRGLIRGSETPVAKVTSPSTR